MVFTRYTEHELAELPTLTEGHTQDLKVDEGDWRVWLDRTGGDFPVQYEVRIAGRWFPCEPSEADGGYGWFVMR